MNDAHMFCEEISYSKIIYSNKIFRNKFEINYRNNSVYLLFMFCDLSNYCDLVTNIRFTETIPCMNRQKKLFCVSNKLLQQGWMRLRNEARVQGIN